MLLQDGEEQKFSPKSQTDKGQPMSLEKQQALFSKAAGLVANTDLDSDGGAQITTQNDIAGLDE